MNFDKILLLAYALAPFLAAFFPWSARMRDATFSPGAVASVARLLALCLLGVSILGSGSVVGVSGSLVGGYPLDIVLSLGAYRFGFLIICEFCFLLAHWLSAPKAVHGGLVRLLISLAQGAFSLFVMSDNVVATGGLLMLSGVVFYYLILFSADGGKAAGGSAISGRMYALYFILGLLTMVWGITEFADKELLFSRLPESRGGVLTWLALLVLAVPLLPWSRWFERSLGSLPAGVTLTVAIFVSAVVLKFSSLFGLVYPTLHWKQKLGIYLIGLLGCAFAIGGIFSQNSRRRMLGGLPLFFFSLVLISVGLSHTSLVISAYFICLFIPAFTGTMLCASQMRVFGPVQKVFVGLMLAFTFGLPGTPVFLIFSAIGARSLVMGTVYMMIFLLLWFLYFFANVHICRKLFMDKGAVPEGDSSLEGEPRPLLAAYGIFLMCFVILTAQVAWRVL